MNIFAMISTQSSIEYTGHALLTFFQTTKKEYVQAFYLIDNDSSAARVKGVTNSEIKIISNSSPLSFAANVNQILRLAEPLQADVFFLNNDLIFTDGWLEPLLVNEPCLLSPLSNREVQYQTENFVWKNALSLEDYLGREQNLAMVVAGHRQRNKGYRPVISLPFFCVKLPYSVYTAVGMFDESFGRGGAEDNDYCIRTCLAGYKICYAMQSFVLHFSGKSTWSGAETAEQTKSRCELFSRVFEEKWGRKLLDLYINEKREVLQEDPRLLHAAQTGDFKTLLQILKKS